MKLIGFACLLLLWRIVYLYLKEKKERKKKNLLREAWIPAEMSMKQLREFVYENEEKLYSLQTIESKKEVWDKINKANMILQELIMVEGMSRDYRVESRYSHIEIIPHIEALDYHIAACFQRLANLMFGEVLLDSPCRETFIEKSEDFLQKSLCYCSQVIKLDGKDYGTKNFLMLKMFFKSLKDPRIISAYKPKFKALGLE